MVRNNCILYEVHELEKIQVEAARIVTGATKLVSIDSLYTETGWETLSSRRLNHKIILFLRRNLVFVQYIYPHLFRLQLEIKLFTVYVMQTISPGSKRIKNWRRSTQRITAISVVYQ